jgi:hypothetical protein
MGGNSVICPVALGEYAYIAALGSNSDAIFNGLEIAYRFGFGYGGNKVFDKRRPKF